MNPQVAWVETTLTLLGCPSLEDGLALCLFSESPKKAHYGPGLTREQGPKQRHPLESEATVECHG